MNIELMMLQVLDDPTGVRIIVETKYPDFSEINGHKGNAYFMIDRGESPSMIYDEEAGKPMEDEIGDPVYDDGEVYDDWHVTDSLGQECTFNSNIELIEFLDSIEGLITKAWVESF